MFCDLVGSTGLAAKLDPEDWRNLVNARNARATRGMSGRVGAATTGCSRSKGSGGAASRVLFKARPRNTLADYGHTPRSSFLKLH
jgi:hypothetical protein